MEEYIIGNIIAIKFGFKRNIFMHRIILHVNINITMHID